MMGNYLSKVVMNWDSLDERFRLRNGSNAEQRNKSDNKQLKHKLKGVGEYAGGEAERRERRMEREWNAVETEEYDFLRSWNEKDFEEFVRLTNHEEEVRKKVKSALATRDSAQTEISSASAATEDLARAEISSAAEFSAAADISAAEDSQAGSSSTTGLPAAEGIDAALNFSLNVAPAMRMGTSQSPAALWAAMSSTAERISSRENSTTAAHPATSEWTSTRPD